jgi:hypothetical protein
MVSFVGFEILTAVVVKSSVFSNIMLCSLVIFAAHWFLSQRIL